MRIAGLALPTSAALVAACSLLWDADEHRGGDTVGSGGHATGGATPQGGTWASGSAAGTSSGGEGGSPDASVGGASGGTGGGGSGGIGGTGPCTGQTDGTTCGTASCTDVQTLKSWRCKSEICVETTMDCAPYACANGACRTSCSVAGDCVPPNDCNSGKCLDCALCQDKLYKGSFKVSCPTNTETLWTNVGTCCTSLCNLECSTDTVCGGTKPLGGNCYVCISNTCATEYNECASDNAE